MFRKFFANAVASVALAISGVSAQSDEGPFQLTKIELLSAGGIELRSTGPTDAVHSLQVSRDLISWRTIGFQRAETGERIF